MQIDDGEMMISFDVQALYIYTSLPMKGVLNIAHERLKNDPTLEELTPSDDDGTVQLLQYCLTSTFCSFRGHFYNLTAEVAMGSPVSSVVVNLFMESFEQKSLEDAKALSIAPKPWKRYVDNMFCLITRQHATRMPTHMNAQEDNIRFTGEEEEETSS